MTRSVGRPPTTSLNALIDDLATIGAFTQKNPDLFGNLERRGDWDIMVRDLDEAESILLFHLGYPDRFEARSYVRSYYYMPWGYIDFFPNWQWNGVPLLDNAQLAKGLRAGPTRISRLSVANEALVLWIQKLLWGGRTEQRYMAAIADAARSEPVEFERGAAQIFGSRIGRRLLEYAKQGDFTDADQMVGILRFTSLIRGMCQHPYVTGLGFVCFVLAEWRLRRSPATPLVEVRDVDQDASRLRDTTSALWPVVAGVTTLGLVDRETAVGAARYVFRYWTTGTKARSRGSLVVVPPCSSRATRTARLINRFAPVPEFRLDSDSAKPDVMLDELLCHARTTALGRLRPVRDSRRLKLVGWDEIVRPRQC